MDLRLGSLPVAKNTIIIQKKKHGAVTNITNTVRQLPIHRPEISGFGKMAAALV